MKSRSYRVPPFLILGVGDRMLCARAIDEPSGMTVLGLTMVEPSSSKLKLELELHDDSQRRSVVSSNSSGGRSAKLKPARSFAPPMKISVSALMSMSGIERESLMFRYMSMIVDIVIR